jgi:hypothetical protein
VRPTRERVPSVRAFKPARASGSPREVLDLADQFLLVDQQDEDSVELLDGAECQPGPSRPAAATGSMGSGRPTKKSRMSARHVQLRSESSEGSMKAVETAANMREASDMKVIEMAFKSKETLAERQERVHRSIADQHIASAQRHAEEDRVVARQTLVVQGQAVGVQREMLEEQRRHNEAKLKNAEILELMRLYVGAGKSPAEARSQAREDVLGE